MITDEQILKIFNELFNTQFRNLNIHRNQVKQWDSMKHAELIIRLQKQLNFKFRPRDISQIENMTEIKNLMTKN